MKTPIARRTIRGLTIFTGLIALVVFDTWAKISNPGYDPDSVFYDEPVQEVYWDMTDPGASPPWSKKNCYYGRDLMLDDLNRMSSDPEYAEFFDNYDYGPVKIPGTASTGHVGIVIYPKGGSVSDGVVLEYTNYESSYFGYYKTREWEKWETNWTGTVGQVDTTTQDLARYWEKPPVYPPPQDTLKENPKPDLDEADAAQETNVSNSYDPNEKVGPSGEGDEHYMPVDGYFSYLILFENDAELATADAQQVIIEDYVDLDNLDPNTFSLGPIMFREHIIYPPPDEQEFETITDLRPERDLIVQIIAYFDAETGKVTWEFSTLDPATWEEPDLEGFLPPNVTQPEGEGSVSYYIALRDGQVSGTLVGEDRNASIIFDTNEPIETEDWINVLDGDQPESAVTGQQTRLTATFPVSWDGSDAVSGIKNYSIFFAEGSSLYQPWLVRTTSTSEDFSGEPGKTYHFLSVARDHAGNLESDPTEADLSVTVLDTDADGVADGEDNCPSVSNPDQSDSNENGTGDACEAVKCDVDGDRDIDRNDTRQIIRKRNRPATGSDDPMDADGDGTITIYDYRLCARQCTLSRCAVR